MIDQNDNLVSIIMPVYNTEHYVTNAIRSLLNQTYTNIEIIVVDDGSTDNSFLVINNAFGNNGKVKLFRKENGGASSARNLGLTKAKGRYITFLDSDDTMDPRTIDILVESIEKNKTDIVIPSVFNEISTAGEKKEIKIFETNMETMSGSEFSKNYMISQGTAWRCSSVLYRADIIVSNSVKFHEGVTAEDYLFNLKYFRYVDKISVVDYTTLNVQKRSDSVTATYRETMFDLVLLLDQETMSFLLDLNTDISEARVLSDKLLIRNTVTYFTKSVKVKSKQVGVNSAIKEVKEKIENNEIISNALNTNLNFKMYFTSKKKKMFAIIIMYLLKIKMYRVAGLCVIMG